MDSNVDCGSISLFTLNSFDVDDKFLTIALYNLANLLTFVMASQYLNFIVLSDWHRSGRIINWLHDWLKVHQSLIFHFYLYVALVHWAIYLEIRISAQINSENITLSEHERAKNQEDSECCLVLKNIYTM